MFSKIDRPVHFPGRTLLGDTRGPVVDTGVDLNGWVYINEVEAVHIGKLFGMIEAEIHEQALEDVAGLQVENDELRQQVAELEEGQSKVVSLDDVRELLQPKTTSKKAS